MPSGRRHREVNRSRVARKPRLFGAGGLSSSCCSRASARADSECRLLREVRRVRHPGATAHSRQNGPAERARPAFAHSASLLGLESRDGPTAQSNTGPQDRLVPFSAPVRNLDTKPGEARAVLATGSGRARTCRPWIGERPQNCTPHRARPAWNIAHLPARSAVPSGDPRTLRSSEKFSPHFATGQVVRSARPQYLGTTTAWG